jgi:biotin synthase-like enzyme
MKPIIAAAVLALLGATAAAAQDGATAPAAGAVTLVCPRAMVRLSAGRETMRPEMQALCFLAGANSIFVGGKLLTTPNPEQDEDARLFDLLDLRPMAPVGFEAAARA